MKITKSNQGFTAVHALLLLVLLGIIGFTGWKVYDAGKSADTTSSSTVTPTANRAQQQPPVSTIPEGFVEYKNEEHGFKFAYPKEWGEVSEQRFSQQCADRINDPSIKVTGDKYEFKFSKNTDNAVYIVTDDFKVVSGVVHCGFVAEVPSQYNSPESFLKEGDYEYVITDNNYECSRTHYYVFGIANIQVKGAKNMSIRLHKVEDTGNDCSVRNQSLIDATKNTLTQQDKKFVSTFKAL